MLLLQELLHLFVVYRPGPTLLQDLNRRQPRKRVPKGSPREVYYAGRHMSIMSKPGRANVSQQLLLAVHPSQASRLADWLESLIKYDKTTMRRGSKPPTTARAKGDANLLSVWPRAQVKSDGDLTTTCGISRAQRDLTGIRCFTTRLSYLGRRSDHPPPLHDESISVEQFCLTAFPTIEITSTSGRYRSRRAS